MKKLIATTSLVAILAVPAWAADQPTKEDIISLNQSIGRLDDRAEKQSEAITKLLDWFAAMQGEIQSLRAQVAAKATAPAPAAGQADVIPPPAYPPQPPVQPAAPVPPAPAPAAAPAPAPASSVAPAAAPGPASSAPAPAAGQQVVAVTLPKVTRTPIVGVAATLATIDRAGKPIEIAAFPSKSPGAAKASDADAALKKSGIPPLGRGRVKTAFDAMMKVEGDGGRYAFSLIAERDSNRNSSCILGLSIGGVKILEADARVTDGKASGFASAEVEGPGAARVSASATCEGLVTLTLLAKAPGSATMEPAQTFYLSESPN